MLERHEQHPRDLARQGHSARGDIIVDFSKPSADAGLEVEDGLERRPVLGVLGDLGVRVALIGVIDVRIDASFEDILGRN